MSARSSENGDSQVNSGQGHARVREDSYRLEPHCCRVCFGRIASVQVSSERREYHCTNCGATAMGSKPDVLCACGLKLRKARGDGRSSLVLVDAGIRCHANKRVSPDFPALYVASYGGAQAEDV